MMRTPDIFFSPVPHRVVGVMLEVAGLNANDLVYDLGCGDGRILIAAAEKHGARGLGVDLDPRMLADCRVNARAAGVEHQIEFLQQDFFVTDLRPASVLALYLLDSINVRLRPKILEECTPGTRIVSYSFEMGEWEADHFVPIAANGVFLWIVPANLIGKWIGDGGALEELSIQQKFQQISGTVMLNGAVRRIQSGKVNGNNFTLILDDADPEKTLTLSGQVRDDLIEASLMDADVAAVSWTAQRVSGTCQPLETASQS